MTSTIKHRRLAIARWIALLVVIALSILIFSLRDQAKQLAVYGYPGIFLLSFLSYATVILPAPGIGIVFAMGAVFNPLFVALAAGSGAALGELSGYLVGFSGQGVVEHAELYNRFSSWMQKNGALTVFALSALPNPFFDLAGIAAGALKMPVRRFLLWCWLGETTKMLYFAYIGSATFDWILNIRG